MSRPRLAPVVDDLVSTPRRRWLTVFVLAAVVAAVWALATPFYGGPDEPEHAVRAVSLARGQFLGRPVENGPDYQRAVDVPGAYASHNTACFVFDSSVPAACQVTDDDAPMTVYPSSAGRYPPLYYALVGWISVFFTTSKGVFAMRLVTGLLAAAFVASASVTAAGLAARRFAGLGLAVALTPMTYFLFGTVNPSALEIAAAISLWLAGYGLLHGSADGVDRALVRRATAAGVALALCRGLGPVWLGLIALALLATAHLPTLRTLVRSRAAQVGAGLIVLAVGIQAAWLLIVKPLDVTGWTEPVDGPFPTLFRRALGGTYERGILPMIGVFDWLSTFPPMATFVLWFGLVGLLVLVAWSVADRRTALTVAAVLLTAVLLPPALEAFEAPKVGFFGWQGRYTLPLAVGIPLLAASGAGERARRIFAGTRLYLVAGGLIIGGQVAALWAALRRNSVGANGSVAFWQSPAWSPPVPALLLLFVFAAAFTALTALLLARSPAGAHDAGSADESGATLAADPAQDRPAPDYATAN
jgi:hypothetical protein